MAQRSRDRGDVIPHLAELLKVLGDCRKRVIDAHNGGAAVRRRLSCPVHGHDGDRCLGDLHDGHRDHFSTGGSIPPEGSRNMILPPRED